MTQTKFFKVARALVVLVVRLAWILVKVVLLAAAAMLRAVTNGPAQRQEESSTSDPTSGQYWNPASRDYIPHMDPNRDR